MEKLYVYADFDWFERPMLVGSLSFDSIRGNETYCFEFDKDWLISYGDILLSSDISNYPGEQYTTPGQDLFGCFGDICPQRWGRQLFKIQEQIASKEEKRPIRRLTSFDYLNAIDDSMRIGAIRFARCKDGEFINTSTNNLRALRSASIAKVRELMQVAKEIEDCYERNLQPSQKSINQLIIHGTALGGARPKASIMDEDGSLTVAKFPSIKDEYDVEGWEHWCHIMARKAGINAAETRIISGDKYHILVSKRFDRTPESKRIHFASALTLLGLTDGNNASTNNGYLDIVDFIIKYGATPENDLKELYRRVAFNIIVGNSDDHFRNHGFLLTPKGWVLSPAYDLNPTLSDNQSLLINHHTNVSDLNILLDSASDYMLTHQEASLIINEVKQAMKSWKKEAQNLNLAKRDIERFAPRIDKWL